MGVVLVHEEFSTREIWPLECPHCRHVWQEEYLVRHLTDGRGHDIVLWLRSGVLVQPPWAGANCPGCGCGDARAFPAGHRPRYTALPLAPAPAAFGPEPVTESGSVPGLNPRSPYRWTQPVLVYALLGIVFLLFTSFEVVEFVARHH
ncbi:hypothetical protein [Streptosporangium subroseum]|uniref:hypothetical protein n=1 Tax=Streptosporangium subroseum TaxID=106412 RepID=UPI0030869AFB|nr:hypothetical protein OHB15_13565 [Streptosporangium subroseum]